MKVPVPEKDSIFSPFALMCPQQVQDACLIGKGGFSLLSLLTQTLTLSKTIPKPCGMQCVSSCVGALEPFELTHVANHHNCLATVLPQFSRLQGRASVSYTLFPNPSLLQGSGKLHGGSLASGDQGNSPSLVLKGIYSVGYVTLCFQSCITREIHVCLDYKNSRS